MSSSDTYIWSSSSNKDLDSITGYLHGEYACVYSDQQINGTLYAGSKALYFVGSYFLFEKKVIIEWDNVRRVEKNENGIDVVLRDDTVHQFTKLLAPDRVWINLVSLHNDALLDRPTSRSSPSSCRASMRRRNSDPLLSSMAVDSDTMLEILQEEEDEEEKEEPLPESAPPRPKVMRRASTAPIPEQIPPATPSKPSQVVKMEESIGHLRLQPIACSYNSINGKLYAGDLGLYFEAKKVFFWNKNDIIILFDKMRQVQMLENSGGIRVVQKEGDAYELIDMDDAHQVWASLIALHNEHLAHHHQMTTTPQRHRPTMRRRNSDPLLSPSGRFDQVVIEVDDDAASTGDLPDEAVLKEPITTPETPVKTFVSPKEEWTVLCRETKYSNVVIQDHVLPCSLDKFYDLFLADEAPHSIGTFMQKQGDFDLRETKWTTSKSNQQAREVHYRHPVNAPLAPPEATARKKQTFRRIGDEGICVTTRTHVDDVPMADCFYVEDRLRIQPNDDESVVVVMEFEITFVKSTMFKGIINKTTSSEFKTFFQRLAKFMSEALGEKPEAIVEEKAVPAAAPTVVPERRWESWLMALIVLLLLIVLAVQVWIMRELRGIKETMQTLQSCTPTNNLIIDNNSAS